MKLFGQSAIFLAVIALIGLILQKKSFSEIVRGTMMTAIGFFVLSEGTGIITGKSINGLATAFNTLMPSANGTPDIDMSQYGTQIGIVMVVAFVINLLVARFTKWKSVFLTGHMLYWFPYVCIAAGVDAGLSGFKLVALATVMSALYMIIAPNLMRPFVKEVTGDDSFTIGHPTTTLSLISGHLGRLIGNKEQSTEDIKFPKSL
jgi:PTS system IIC component